MPKRATGIRNKHPHQAKEFKLLRQALNMSQQELAYRLGLPKASGHVTISNYECGHHKPPECALILMRTWYRMLDEKRQEYEAAGRTMPIPLWNVSTPLIDTLPPKRWR